MDWVLYDNGLRHERVKFTIGKKYIFRGYFILRFDDSILVTTSLVTSLIELQIVDQCDCYQICKRNSHFVTISSDMRYTGTNITF